VRVEEDAVRHRFIAYVEDQPAGYVLYRRDPDTVIFTHTVVEDAYAGRGVGGALARGALDQVRGAGLRVIAQCPFISAWIDKHPQYRDLVRTQH
jgi:uncharacterized protein